MSSGHCEQADVCVRDVVRRARIARPFLYLVPGRHVASLVRKLYWKCITSGFKIDWPDIHATLLGYSRNWLSRGSGIPWWAVLIIKLALPVIVKLIVEWLQARRHAVS